MIIPETLHNKLISATTKWASGHDVNTPELTELKQQIALENHTFYFQNIPFYRKHCERNGVGATTTIHEIKNRLMITDDYFKSYSASFIEKRDFESLNAWISNISTQTPSIKSKTIDLDTWFQDLEAQHTHLVFSSGTSGHMSFVPRDQKTWDDFLSLPMAYLPFLMAQKGLLPTMKKVLLMVLSRFLSVQRLSSLIKQFGLKDFDGFFLNFAGGNQGVQLVAQQASQLTAKREFLYPIAMTPQAVRAIITQSNDPEDRQAAHEFLRHTVYEKDHNYDRILRSMEASIQCGKKIIVFGTPYLVMELCQKLAAANKVLKAPRGSQVIYGGGWKSFQGERISEQALLKLIETQLGISAKFVTEGYSMTEIQGVMMKCSEGKYHIPPFFDYVLFDEELKPKNVDAESGTLGIIDPFAKSYPGFIITGDDVVVQRSNCRCGIKGPAIAHIERTPGKEVKGCGGIMAAVNA